MNNQRPKKKSLLEGALLADGYSNKKGNKRLLSPINKQPIVQVEEINEPPAEVFYDDLNNHDMRQFHHRIDEQDEEVK